MATKSQMITAEQYLKMSFEYDAEFVDGEVVERTLSDRLHSKIQMRILLALGDLAQSSALYPYPDLRLRLESRRIWGVPNIWVVDPHSKRLYQSTVSGLQNVSSPALADYPFELTPAELFSDL